MFLVVYSGTKSILFSVKRNLRQYQRPPSPEVRSGHQWYHSRVVSWRRAKSNLFRALLGLGAAYSSLTLW